MHRSVLLQMSNGRPPTKVLCTGHSLGAGVASICGVWASAQWVGADIRVVTFGSPATGNEQWAEVCACACTPMFAPDAECSLHAHLLCMLAPETHVEIAELLMLFFVVRPSQQGPKCEAGGGAAMCGRLWLCMADGDGLEFTQAFKRAVGRSYRVIDRLDVVPALPPFESYVQLDFPLWIQVWALGR